MPLFFIKDPECIFVHVPKTAGYSIRQIFFQKNYEGPWFGDELPEAWSDVFKFGFVRNPFDRLVSAWKMFTQGVNDSDWRLPEGANLAFTLADVIHLGMDPNQPFGHPRYNNIQLNPLTRLKNHILPQSHEYHGLQHVDFIGRFESLNRDFSYVLKQLGLPSRPLPKSNWTRREPYQSYFDDETRAAAEQYYAEDLTKFGYEF